MTKATKFTLAIILQCSIVLVVLLFHLAIKTWGTELVLRIEPVDPTSPLRGDYVTFQYSELSNLNSYLISGNSVRNGSTVYVTLRKSGRYWYPERILTTPPQNDQVFIKGKVASGISEVTKNDFSATNSSIHILYGIEEYFIPEGSGRNFSFPNKETVAIVSVDKEGNAIVKRILIDGKNWPGL